MRKTFVSIGLVVFLPVAVWANALTLTNRSDLCSGTATSLTYVVEVTGTNAASDVVSNLTGHFGSSDGGLVPARWGIATDLGTNVVGTLVSNTVYGTQPQRTYWFTCSTSGSLSGTVWATSSGTYVTPAGGTPGTGTNISNPLGFTPSGPSVTNVSLPAATIYSNLLKAAATPLSATNFLMNISWTSMVTTGGGLGTNCTFTFSVATNGVVQTPSLYGFASSTAGVATNDVVQGTVNLAALNTLLSNLVNQVAAINSNQHKLGMP